MYSSGFVCSNFSPSVAHLMSCLWACLSFPSKCLICVLLLVVLCLFVFLLPIWMEAYGLWQCCTVFTGEIANVMFRMFLSSTLQQIAGTRGYSLLWVELLVSSRRKMYLKENPYAAFGLVRSWKDLLLPFVHTKKLSRILFGNMVPLWRSRKPRNQPQCRRRKIKAWMTIKMPWAAFRGEFLTSINCWGEGGD